MVAASDSRRLAGGWLSCLAPLHALPRQHACNSTLNQDHHATHNATGSATRMRRMATRSAQSFGSATRECAAPTISWESSTAACVWGTPATPPPASASRQRSRLAGSGTETSSIASRAKQQCWRILPAVACPSLSLLVASGPLQTAHHLNCFAFISSHAAPAG